MTDTLSDRLLDAALMHVAFDGWTETTFNAAVADAEVDPVVARGLFPRGAVDLAIAYHKQGDAEMLRKINAADLSEMRFRDKVIFAVRARIEAAEDREAVRRGTTLFALPLYAGDGAKLIWGTADAIWTALGDTSDDINWYTKRATLSAVYSSTVLYWLGDDSLGNDATWEFLDRRIEDVMRFEKVKAGVRENRLLSTVLAGPMAVLSRVSAPRRADDLPGGVGH
ncbi:COQ9 family protein [Tropicibacter naphthalenivorans]|uniref:RpsU-divergently transcribed protein n=1 Tax=Tropicibacter naphthalenivorans TaxID=441103 RepID=A0A0P1GBV0_9RHOB|nr:COQ9 family protein [Tropicibacter naphthalenivorans]CUH78734.1 rpsU-divergently transcribed protein [Tropicibacter naphthalenivorans]SMC81347.1 ubiquinone biosynthesis protein COQ9 [Tropicibacter naphthalenivorans]